GKKSKSAAVINENEEAAKALVKGPMKDSIKFANVQGTVKYIADTDKSILNWKSGLHTGYVKFHAGVLYAQDNQVIAGEFYMDMDSIVDTDIDYLLMKETLENVLRSSDWFFSNKFPLSVFKIKSTVYSDTDSVQIFGSLNLLDISQDITFKASIDFLNDSIIAFSECFLIDRTHWNILTMSDEHVKDDNSFIVPDKIEIRVEVIAKH
ncbi:MAG: YceI family protein, partial [Bacteroidota bacterium]|nr:YceI family protein [Bacteroidota bacterium]